MIDKDTLEVGQKVHYQPEHYGDEFLNGIVKEINDAGVWVAYSHDGNWDGYADYIAEMTALDSLKLGWG